MPLSHRIEGNLDGPPILLVHGMGVTFPIWQNLTPLLCPYYKVIQVELPGNGAAPPPAAGQPYYTSAGAALEELRCQLGIQQWDVLGYSMGAWAVQSYLQRWPGHARRVIYLCPARLSLLWALGVTLLNIFDHLQPALGNWLLQGRPLYLLVLLLGFNGRPHPYAQIWSREIASQPVEVTRRQLRDLPGRGLALLDSAGLPAVCLWGSQDTVAPSPLRPRMRDRIIPGSHSAPMLHAPQIAAEILAFLEAEE